MTVVIGFLIGVLTMHLLGIWARAMLERDPLNPKSAGNNARRKTLAKMSPDLFLATRRAVEAEHERRQHL